MKAAQCEMLGWRSVIATRPGRDDRWLLMLVIPHARNQMLNVSIVPDGTNISFCIIPSPSYWATLLGSLQDASSRRIDLPLAPTRMRDRGSDDHLPGVLLLCSLRSFAAISYPVS
jgi:hypothetical protein